MATFDWIETTALVSAIFFGSVALASASWVWLSRRVFGYAGFSLSAAGAILIGLAAWRTADVPPPGQSGSQETAQALQPLERKLASLEQGIARLESAAQTAAKTGNAPSSSDLKPVLDRLDGHTARLISLEALRTQISDLQEASKQHTETLAEGMASFGEQTRARLIALQMSLDRVPPSLRPAAGPRPAAGATANRRGTGPTGAEAANGAGSSAVRDGRLPGMIEPAAGPGSIGSSLWIGWPTGRDAGTDTEGAEGAR